MTNWVQVVEGLLDNAEKALQGARTIIAQQMQMAQQPVPQDPEKPCEHPQAARVETMTGFTCMACGVTVDESGEQEPADGPD